MLAPCPQPPLDHHTSSVSQHPKDDLGSGATVKTEKGEVKSGQKVYEEGQDRASKLKEQGQSAAQEQVDEAQG